MATAEKLLTAEEYAALPANGVPTELVHGRVMELNVPTPRHGEICANTVFILREFLQGRGLGRVVCNDGGVVTARDPDTLRGADISYYSFARVPKGPLPRWYLTVVPEVVFEVRSMTDRWRDILTKVTEYLHAGVSVVCILDESQGSLHIFRPDDTPTILGPDDELTLPGVLDGFAVRVGRFFD